MVSTNTNLGEGIFIAEIAMAGHRNPSVMLRASKVLADNDWNDMYYQARYTDPQGLTSCLEKTRVQYLILDISPPRKRSYPHHEELMQIVNGAGSPWKLSESFPGDGGNRAVRIYRTAEIGSNTSGTALVASDIFANASINLDHWPLAMNLNCTQSGGPVIKP